MIERGWFMFEPAVDTDPRGKTMRNVIRCDKDLYLRQGYAVVRGVLPVAELDAINLEMGSLFALQLRRLKLEVDESPTREAFRDNAVRLLQADVGTYISTARLTQMLPSANRLMLSEPILDLARGFGVQFPVISTRLSNHIMCDLLRVPGGYHKAPPHQDWRSAQGSLDSVVLWAPTTPSTSEEYPLQVAPGSHLHGLLATRQHIMTPTVDDVRITGTAFESLSVEPGDVVVFSTFLVHRTGEKGGTLVRIAFSARYNNALESTYVAHGYQPPTSIPIKPS